MAYYVSYEYTGNKELQYEPFKSWFIQFDLHKKLTSKDFNTIMSRIVSEVTERYNIDEYDGNIKDDIVILFMKEMRL